MTKTSEKVTVFINDIPDDFVLAGDLAIDTETMGLNHYRDKLCVLQFSNGNGHCYLVQFIDKNYTALHLRKLLADETRCKIFHFARFDLAAIKLYLELDLKNIFCTKIASRLIRTYTDAHSLKALCSELLSVQLSKQQQSSYWGSETLSVEQRDYAARDVLYLHQLRVILEKMLTKENRLDLAQEVFAFLPTRVKLDLMGWNEQDIFIH